MIESFALDKGIYKHSVFSKIIDNEKEVNWPKKNKMDAFLLIVLIRIHGCVSLNIYAHMCILILSAVATCTFERECVALLI